MAQVKITNELVEEMGLSQEEYANIKKAMGREPNYTELGLFSAMWSEHCSYKNSKKILKLFPTTGKQVVEGPGENAGVVDIGDGFGVVFKVESHNHPSAVEPYEASATGGGGCLRDIFTMGARPLALLGSLRLGRIENDKVKYLLKEIARGFTTYANIAEIPVIGGEIYFDETYEGNPLVNAMAIGVVKLNKLSKARASGVGNLVLTIGGPTGRDGVAGAAFASKGLSEEAEQKKSAVAIGDPQMGKILREACLEIIDKSLVVGMQDMGAAGLICSTCETAYKAGTGIEVDISKVPRKEEGMNAYEIMLSESQERMLAIVEENNLDAVKKILDKWGVPFAVIGKVTNDGMVRVKDGDKLEAEVAAKALSEGPVYTREEKKPAYLDEANKLDPSSIPQPENLNDTLLKLLAHPTIASKEWVYQKGDPKLGKNIPVGPGSDGGVMAVPGSKKGIAATTDCNGSYIYLDPFTGGAIAVAEAARNLVCTGAKPLAITDGINFGNPKNPEIYWQFHQAVLGISEACRKLDTPVVSGNVSFNNENPKGSIDPTPVIGMVGVMDDASKAITQNFKAAGDVILLIGENREELGGSLYLQSIHKQKKGPLPKFDLDLEKRVQDTVLEAIQKELVSSAHDCSEGGLAVALAECCMSNKDKMLGAQISELLRQRRTNSELRTDALLFGESQSRIIISAKPENADKIEALCKKNNVPVSKLGIVGSESLKIGAAIDLKVSELGKTWRESIPNALR